MFEIEKDVLKSQVISYVQFLQKVVEKEFISTIFGVIFAILLITAVLRFAPIRFRDRIPAKKVFLLIASLSIALFAIGSFFITNIDRIQRIKALNNDISNWNPIVDYGTVDNRFAFEKGGVVVVINDETYYVLPPLGLMDVGNSYGYQYLPESKCIVSFSSNQ